MLTMRQIWQVTPGDRKERAQDVRVTKIRYGLNKLTKLPTALSTTYSVEIQNGRPKQFKYVTLIEFLPKKHVKLSCSCGDFTFRWEYALWKKGAADLRHSNGEPPIDRNPALRPACCKHCLALYRQLVDTKMID